MFFLSFTCSILLTFLLLFSFPFTFSMLNTSLVQLYFHVLTIFNIIHVFCTKGVHLSTSMHAFHAKHVLFSIFIPCSRFPDILRASLFILLSSCPLYNRLCIFPSFISLMASVLHFPRTQFLFLSRLMSHVPSLSVSVPRVPLSVFYPFFSYATHVLFSSDSFLLRFRCYAGFPSLVFSFPSCFFYAELVPLSPLFFPSCLTRISHFIFLYFF